MSGLGGLVALLVAALVAAAAGSPVYDGAWQVLQELQGKDPGDPHYQRAVELVNEALRAYEGGDIDGALALLDEAKREAAMASAALSPWIVVLGGVLLVAFTYHLLPRVWALAWAYSRREWIVEEGGKVEA